MKNKEKDIESIEMGTIEQLTEEKETTKITNQKKEQKKKNPLVTLFLILTLFSSIAYFLISCILGEFSTLSIDAILLRILLILFTIVFVFLGLTLNRKKKALLLTCSILLIAYFGIGILSMSHSLEISLFSKMEDLRGKSLTEVMTWASKNNIEVKQEYEYSDMVDEYHVISQDLEEGKTLKDVKQVTVAISEGASPYKEIILPNMLGWKTTEVIEFVEQNYLRNVDVSFIASEKQENTVIEQSKMGSIQRDEKLLLTFSYGEKRTNDEVKMINLKGKSKFVATFYLAQQGLNYKLIEDFSEDVKKGAVISQSIEEGKAAKLNEDSITLTISKGPKIKVPNLLKLSLTEVTDWIIQNKLKLELSRSYDDTIKENHIIKANFKENDIIAQGSIVQIVLSKGNLTMPKFKDYNEFKAWAREYNIVYQEEHVFSDTVKIGEVVSYSYKSGDTIQNGDSITVQISDGKELKVPNVIGKTKANATSILKNLGLKVNYVSKASSKKKDTVIGQSISASATVSEGTTITLTISTGTENNSSKGETNKTPATNNNTNSNTNSSKPEQEETPPTPTCDRSKTTDVYILDIFLDDEDPTNTCTAIKERYNQVKFTCTYQKDPDRSIGSVINAQEFHKKALNHCDTYNLIIATR